MDYLDRTLVHAKELVTKLEECITRRDKFIDVNKGIIVDLIIEATDINDTIQPEEYGKLIQKIREL